MKKINMISRVILAVITFIVFSIITINEDSSWNIVPVIFSLIVFVLSFPSTIFAEKIIKFGNTINDKSLKKAYYIVLPIILVAICLIVYMSVLYIDDNFITTPNEMGAALGQALLLLFIVIFMTIVIVLPYIQAIIINILKKTINKY